MNGNEKFLDDDGYKINWGTRYKRPPAGITLSDEKIPVDVNNDFIADYYKADIVSAQDYYPFGMLMPERNFNASTYRFGFQGQEGDDEVSGSGNHTTALFWEYDTRLGRRWNQDPKPNPSISNYAAFANNPIWFVDPTGADTTFADKQAYKDFTKALNTVNNTIKSLNSELQGYKNELKQDLRKGQIRRLNRKIEKTKSNLSDWNKLKDDFNTIINSPVEFTYTSNTSGLASNENGKTNWNDKSIISRNENGVVTGGTVYISIRTGHYEAVIHENRHGIQVQNDVPYTFESEAEAYRYQYIYDANSVRESMNAVYELKYGNYEVKPIKSFNEKLKDMINYLYDF